MNTPYYIERTANGANAITLESILLENRVIFWASQLMERALIQ